MSTLTDQLSVVLADTYTLYLQTQNFHWNVEGEDFHQYHVMFEEQYTEYAAAIDVIAENIRTFDVAAPGTFAAFSDLATIEMQPNGGSATDMAETLASQTEDLIQQLQALVDIAQDEEDVVVEDLATQRLAVHKKFLWMLRSSTR